MATQAEPPPSSWFSFSYDQVLLALSPTHAFNNWYYKPKEEENPAERHVVVSMVSRGKYQDPY
jgi:hypothetical protein